MQQHREGQPICSDYRKPMVLMVSLPRLGLHPELRTYRCPDCKHVETFEMGN